MRPVRTEGADVGERSLEELCERYDGHQLADGYFAAGRHPRCRERQDTPVDDRDHQQGDARRQGSYRQLPWSLAERRSTRARTRTRTIAHDRQVDDHADQDRHRDLADLCGISPAVAQPRRHPRPPRDKASVRIAPMAPA